jgi:hypothetical protein
VFKAETKRFPPFSFVFHFLFVSLQRIYKKANMNVASLNNLWSYLQGLSLSASNQRWLGERLIEASNVAKSKSTNVATHRVHHRRKALSDAELSERLAQYAPLTDANFSEISTEDFANFAKKRSGRITKGLGKWL